jgi:hypothetical protein
MPSTRKRKPNPSDDGLAAQSVAGEEDPGAALDAQSPAAPERPGPRAAPGAPPSRKPLAPGDEAAAGTPGTGETVCDRCGGRGTIDGGERCPVCGGSGTVIHGIGGG